MLITILAVYNPHSQVERLARVNVLKKALPKQVTLHGLPVTLVQVLERNHVGTKFGKTFDLNLQKLISISARPDFQKVVFSKISERRLSDADNPQSAVRQMILGRFAAKKEDLFETSGDAAQLKLIFQLLQQENAAGFKEASRNVSLDFSGLDLSHLNLSGFVFQPARFGQTNLYGANLIGAAFLGGDLTAVNFRDSDLRTARFEDWRAQLREVIARINIDAECDFTGALRAEGDAPILNWKVVPRPDLTSRPGEKPRYLQVIVPSRGDDFDLSAERCQAAQRNWRSRHI